MLEQFLIFTKGGLILYQQGALKLAGEPISHLIQSVLLENRGGDASFSHDKYTMEWILLNEHDLIFAVVYEKLLAKNVMYVGDLLELVSRMVVKEYGKSLPTRGGPPAHSGLIKKDEFDKKYREALIEAEKRVEERKAGARAPGDFWESKKGQDLIKNKGATPDAKQTKEGKDEDKDAKDSKDSDSIEGGKAKKLSKIELAAQKRAAKAAAKAEQDAKQGASSSKTPDWHKTQKKATLSETDKSEEKEGSDQPIFDVNQLDFEDKADSEAGFLSDDEEDEEDGSTYGKSPKSYGNSSNSSNSSGFGLFKFIKGLTQKELTEDHLRPVMEDIKSHLIAKNVASDIADSICDSVSKSLLGQTHGNFKSISGVVKNAMADALTRILTPKRHIDISREIHAAKESGRPYSIVFVGVNGVGKSTSLAKVCAWLLKQNHRVMIAACDTFRSGAVEQLKVHSKSLGGVPIYESGYGKDAAYIAQQAIAKANTDAIDVVLIDTAGRMQDNEPLMAALAKLVKVNNPDLILFVGEALVGNASVDQLTKFNRAFEEYGDLSTPRAIDGILLTKFDTVDDKVGAAISMVYTTGQPIIFVGVGQTYSDLRTLNIKKIVDILARGRT
jgi:signal recognition particle receptor subunit alpha